MTLGIHCFSLQNRYNRIDMEIPDTIALDNVDALEQLVELAEQVDLSASEEFIITMFLSKNPLNKS